MLVHVFPVDKGQHIDGKPGDIRIGSRIEKGFGDLIDAAIVDDDRISALALDLVGVQIAERVERDVVEQCFMYGKGGISLPLVLEEAIHGFCKEPVALVRGNLRRYRRDCKRRGQRYHKDSDQTSKLFHLLLLNLNILPRENFNYFPPSRQICGFS